MTYIAAEGLIFQSFANNPENYTLTVSELDKNKITSIHIGIDFGGNKSKTTFVATAYIDGFKKLIVIADYKIDGGKGEVSPEIINTDFIRFVKALYQRYNPILIKFAWADNENQAVINGLRIACIRARLLVKIVDCYKAPRNGRISLLTSMMSQGRFFVLENCKNVIGSLSEQIWDPKITDKDERLDDGTCDIDTADALEYSFSKFIKPLMLAGGENVE